MAKVNFVTVKDCMLCSHKQVCKYREDYEHIAAVIESKLKDIDGENIDGLYLKTTIECKLQETHGYTFTYGSGNEWISTNPAPNIPAYPYPAGPCDPLDPYKITCTSDDYEVKSTIEGCL